MAITEFREAQNAGIGMTSIRVFARVSWLLSKRVEWSPSFSALLIAWLASSFKGTVDVTNSYAGYRETEVDCSMDRDKGISRTSRKKGNLYFELDSGSDLIVLGQSHPGVNIISCS
ncbi:hypothetical protein SAY87_022904 [Trapa incisa]|uniref:Uncharacterized protein n=1 Tax=Trapa incisa TaxID=236973 RepID=A0AAN7K8J1_9MYRT|nr:hypothetical protein SAY87_022904 [Trapa incisa]